MAEADLVLAPGLAVDAAGTRMGQGGGCYDKALPRRRPGTPVVVLLHPGELIGAGEPGLPREQHDAPVDAVLTVHGVTWLSGRPADRPWPAPDGPAGVSGRHPRPSWRARSQPAPGTSVRVSSAAAFTAAGANGQGNCVPSTQAPSWSA